MLTCTNIPEITSDSIKKGFYSIGNEIGKIVIIFGVGLSSSQHTDNKKRR